MKPDPVPPRGAAVEVVVQPPARRSHLLLGAGLLGVGVALGTSLHGGPAPALALAPPAPQVVAPAIVPVAAPVSPQQDPPAATRDVDLVICLDTSGSMDGLLDAARKKLWDVCALLAQARPAPRLRVALLQFGCDAAPERGHVVIESDLSTDLDTVYEKLVALRASGGDERVGRVLREALDGLSWSRSADALKVILVAGNESADQDPEHPFGKLAREALARDAVVHAIYCAWRSDDPAVVATWRELARQGGGEFTPIDLGAAAILVETPQDQELIALNAALNRTYLPYGSLGSQGQERQVAQDLSAAEQGGASGAAARAACKSWSNAYHNDHWDLVDRSAAEGFRWDALAPADWPEAFQGKSLAELRAHVEALRSRRAALQKQIQEVAAARQQAIDAELARRQGEAARTLDAALLGSIKKQGEARGLAW